MMLTFHRGGLADIGLWPQTQLTPSITAKHEQSAMVYKLKSQININKDIIMKNNKIEIAKWLNITWE